MLVCLTGIDGCGKGTQRAFLVEHLESRNIPVSVSKAYGDAEKECFAPFIDKWSQESILFLFQALHVEQRQKAQQAISQGKIVIADRWDEAYIAYHSRHGILAADEELRNRLNGIAFSEIIPDITFLLDVPIEVARRRLEARGMDFFDRLPTSYQRTMRNEYLRLAKERRWHVIGGTQTVSEIHGEIVRRVDELMNR